MEIVLKINYTHGKRLKITTFLEDTQRLTAFAERPSIEGNSVLSCIL